VSIVAALQPVVEVLEQLGVAYHVGGSVASSAHGSPRATNDVDVVADLRLEHVRPLCAALADRYYASPELLGDAVRRRSCGNLVHLATGYKVDLFVQRGGEFDLVSLHRHVERRLAPEGRAFRFATAEDILLRKLEWYRDGGQQSDRQWSDVLGLLRARGGELDRAYVGRWAPTLGVAELMARAEREATAT
jgi:hypothetical protein